MKRFIVLLLSLLIFVVDSSSFTAGAAPAVSARSAVMLCADSGAVLFSHNPEERLSMASTTKIMTAVLAVESNRLAAEVCVGEEVLAVDGTSLGLQPGDRMTLRDLTKGMLLSSGNDAANAVAVAVGGSIDAFVAAMNRKAAEIGMQNTSFATPSGLDAETHYSTALDMAKLGAYAMRLPEFYEMASAYRASISVNAETLWLTNHNRLLNMYEGAVGIKTGFTKKSGRCLVSAAKRDGRLLITVTLQDANDWADHAALLDYGFAVCKSYIAFAEGTEYTVDVVGSTLLKLPCSVRQDICYTGVEAFEDIQTVVCLAPFVYAPVRADTQVGTVYCYHNGILLGAAPICTEREAELFFSDREIPLREKWKNIWNGWFSDG